MNSIFNRFQFIGNPLQFCQHVNHSFVKGSSVSARELKIVVFVAVVLVALGQIVYWMYRYQWSKSMKQHPFHLPKFQKINDLLQHAVIRKEPVRVKLKLLEDKRVEQLDQNKNEIMKVQKDKEKINENPPLAQPLPPCPHLDYLTVFKSIARQTPNAIEYFPFSFESCRFQDILCPKETRVDILGATKEVYLHANHVKLVGKHFILTQYPLPLLLPLFWRMCQQACLIVDLTNEGDMKKGLIAYYPQSGQSKQCADLLLSCKKEQCIDGMKGRLLTYHVQEQNEKETKQLEFDISRLHYEGLDDGRGITEDDLDQMIAIIEDHDKNSSHPVIVHCRAGVGRSGTICVAYALKQLMKQGKVEASNLLSHITDLILEGRKQRGFVFVQTPDQFAAIWKWSWRALHRMQQKGNV